MNFGERLRLGRGEARLRGIEDIGLRDICNGFRHIGDVQGQLTERKLKNAFQGFIDAGVNLEGAKDVQPVFDPAPEINGQGLLVATGYYPTTPNRIVFTMRFVYELPHWKLIGLDINLVKP